MSSSILTSPASPSLEVNTAKAPARMLPMCYGSYYLLEAVQSFCQWESAVGNPQDELKLYLESGQELTDDVIGWWGHQMDLRFPTMRQIAHDYLAIQGSATPSE
ncbi:hypothetical protein APHAL10511_006937 [Amanita phalloides]|nr:hypothetical protein APHAL10511_006937 [Amanita phalloides]